jgi:hypothetical protein
MAFNVVMLGKSYMNPTLPRGVFSGAMGYDYTALTASQVAAIQTKYPKNADAAIRTADQMAADGYDQATIDQTLAEQFGSTPARTWVDDLRDNLISKVPDITDAGLKIALKQAGVTETQANTTIAKKNLGFNLAGNMPLIVIGGVALLAILFMAGTRRRA